MIQKVLSDGTSVTAFPITAAQQLMYYLSITHGANVPVLNIGTGYYWQGDMDVEKMKQAMQEAIDRCDTMRLRFVEDDDYTILQYVVQDSGIEIGYEDLSDISLEQAHDIMKARTFPLIDMFEKPLHTITILRLADNYCGFYLKLQHLAMDGYSAKVFISDVMAIYLNKTCGMPYPTPMRPYIPALIKDLQYKQTEQYAKDKAYWAGTLQGPEPIYTDYLIKGNRLKAQRIEKNDPDLRAADVHGGSPESRTLLCRLTEDESNALMAMCKARSISVPCAVMTALRTALSVFNDNETDVSFKVMINRRGTLAEKKSGGVRMHFFPLRTIVSPDITFAQAVRAVEDSQSEIFAHSNINTLEMIQIRHAYMKKGAGIEDTYDCMSFSYQPLMEVPAADEAMKKSSVGIWYNNDASMQNLYLTVKHRSSDNGLDFIFEYRTNANPLEDLKLFYDKMYQTLLIGTGNPDITVGELLGKIKL